MIDLNLSCYVFVAQLVRNPSAMWETWVWSLGWEDPWRRERLPSPVFWPGEFHGLYNPWGCKELDMTEQLSLSLSRVGSFLGWMNDLMSWGNQRVRNKVLMECVLCASQSLLLVISPLILATASRGRWYYCPPDRDEEARAQQSEPACQRISGGPRIQSQAVCL